ncbi:HEAT repeat domain-containing protein [Lentzea sp. NPDC059081]|uniref:HEAT repeat domain-containing protein n=1 Tax=Lentzea sp. NPDC059081 TaxID=3346719 RepID=UPI0036A4C0FD
MRQVEDALAVYEVLMAPEKGAVSAGPSTLQELLAAYQTSRAPRIMSKISFLLLDGLNTPVAAELAERWWDSDDDWEANVAVLAARGTGLLDRERLLRKVTGDSSVVAWTAIESLTGDGTPEEIAALHSVLRNPDQMWEGARVAATKRLVAIGGLDAEAVFQEWTFRPAEAPWRFDRSWLHRNAAQVVPRMIEALPTAWWYYEAPFALGELRAAEAVGPLCEAVLTASQPLPMIEALGKIGSADAVPTLVRLFEHADPKVRAAVLQVLGKLGGAELTVVAMAACDDTDVLVRQQAARVLVRHADARAVPLLLHLCETAHAAQAADALARIGDPRALPMLWHLFFHHPDKAARHAAGRGLARIDGADRGCWSTDPQAVRAYVWLLGHKPGWPRHALRRAIEHTDALVRARAAETCGRLADPAAAEDVRALLDDPDPRVRTAARHALDRLGPEAES